jgi:2-oxoacid:acceptor oxidoreductase gamma subunit (pyruvate/2-ketoisovalerate family)
LLEVRFHGRAGQGIVTAAELLAKAVNFEGKFSQAFPIFGSEKRGPPVMSFCRIDEKPIKIHEEIECPDIVVVAEPSVLKEVKIDAGLKENGLIILNSKKPCTQKFCTKKVFTVNGTEIALKYLGKPITNTVMLGALAKISKIVSLESIKKAVNERFPEKIAQLNNKIIEECFNSIK